ncbi:hypothetical protein EII30_04430 [Leucobacter sp. OH1287]|nr:hypothetical protein EII30_04430 [Leucobacter sp. OH1287]
MQMSPYTPGTIAEEIPGRESQLSLISQRLERVAQLGEMNKQFEIFVGPRGVGKTSLLRKAEKLAKQRQFETIWVTAGNSELAAALIDECYRTVEATSNKLASALKSSLQRMKITLPVVTLDLQQHEQSNLPTQPAERVLEAAFKAATDAALQSGKKGLVVFIDELQQADKASLTALAFAWQHLQAEADHLPLAIFTAGLGNTRDVLTDSASFAERFSYRHLANLSPQESKLALILPAGKLGVKWHTEALKTALEFAAGYPHFLQLIGDCAWEVAGDPDADEEITAVQAAAAGELFKSKRTEFFASRLAKTTEKELELLQAMATLQERKLRRADIAKALGVSTTDISAQRASLLSKGLIEAPEYGYLQFTAPGFGKYIREVYAL